jgi:hypothetical protein
MEELKPEEVSKASIGDLKNLVDMTMDESNNKLD